jgi:hypothetical protein
MVGSGECPFAESALEGPVAIVFAVLAGELVGAGENPSASLPGALVRLRARVRLQVMGLQVRRLRVRLGASGKRAQMSRHFLTASSLPPCANVSRSIFKIKQKKKRGRNLKFKYLPRLALTEGLACWPASEVAVAVAEWVDG